MIGHEGEFTPEIISISWSAITAKERSSKKRKKIDTLLGYIYPPHNHQDPSSYILRSTTLSQYTADILSRSSKAKSLLDVGNTEGLLEGADRAIGRIVEKRVDFVNVQTGLELGNSLADRLDGTGRRTLLGEVEQVLGEGNTKSILELGKLASAWPALE